MTDDNESELARLLAVRAQQLVVNPDPESVLEPRHSHSSEYRGRLLWLAAAAAVLVAGGFGLTQWPVHDQTQTASTGRTTFGASTEFAAPLTGAEIIVWLDPAASIEEIQVVALRLNDSTAVETVEYVDRDATYSEFTAYYADEPEIIELVEPQQLPTSFRVTTSTPSAIAELLNDLTAVQHIDLPDE